MAAIADSHAPATRRQYASAWNAWMAWASRHGHTAMPATPEALIAYLTTRVDSGVSIATARMDRAAIAYAHRAAGLDDPAAHAGVAEVLRGLARRAAGRGRGQAQALTADDMAAIIATAHLPRRTRRGTESDAHAKRRGAVDAAIAALLFQGALRRSEAAALTWGDVQRSRDRAGLLVTVRRSKTNQTGDRADIRYLKNGAAEAVWAVRPPAPDDDQPVLGGLNAASVGRRLAAAAETAGIEGRITGHSGRVGLASELTARGASVTEVMLAGGWETARMVAHYSAGAAAEQGAVAKYL